MEKIPFYKSFFFRLMFMVSVCQLFVVLLAGVYFFQKAYKDSVDRAYLSLLTDGETVKAFVHSSMESFAQNLNLLAISPAISEFDQRGIASILKSYKVSSLFVSGEQLKIYNADNVSIADNHMVFLDTVKASFPFFTQVSPSHPFVGPVQWENNLPFRLIAVNIRNQKARSGVMSALYNLRRTYDYLSEYRLGHKGFVILVDEKGGVLYHPDVKILRAQKTIFDLKIADAMPEDIPTRKPIQVKLLNGEEYLATFVWDGAYKTGAFLLIPLNELSMMAWHIISGLLMVLMIGFILSLLVTYFLALRISTPIRILAENMAKVQKGNLEDGPIINRDDELGMLARGFDSMRISLRESMIKIARHRQHLEEQVLERTSELEASLEELEKMSRTDPLTGLPNRRDILEKIQFERYRSERTSKPFVFIMADVDHFKQFNDNYGHECGDEVLKAVSVAIVDVMRKHDFVSRWGGEEFLLVLPETDVKNGKSVAERLRAKVEGVELLWNDEKLSVTLTLGVSEFSPLLGVEKSIDLADRALYQGKRGTRNCVVSQEDLKQIYVDE